MFNPKLEAFLDSLEVETYHPSCAPSKIIAPRTELDRKMDKYDIFKQDNWTNAGIHEFPVLVPKNAACGITLAALQNAWGSFMYAPVWATYGRIQRGSHPVQGFTDEPAEVKPPVETPYDRLKKKLIRFDGIQATHIANPALSKPHRIPDVTHTLVAWRGWAVDNGGLEALGSDARWIPKQLQHAVCRHYNHEAPAWDCSCGYWSFKGRESALQAMSRYEEDIAVIGTVEIWGRVIECENGWRSEFAYPKELWLLQEGLESLSWTYGVPVRKL